MVSLLKIEIDIGEIEMSAPESKLDSVLARVQKPARYLGNEWNAVHKDHDQAAMRMVLAFPDL